MTTSSLMQQLEKTGKAKCGAAAGHLGSRSKRTEQHSTLELNPGNVASDKALTKQLGAFPSSSVPPLAGATRARLRQPFPFLVGLLKPCQGGGDYVPTPDGTSSDGHSDKHLFKQLLNSIPI